jgi:phospholipase C
MADNAMDRIKHLVVVMMENQSFDNLMGFLYAKKTTSRQSISRHRHRAGKPRMMG